MIKRRKPIKRSWLRKKPKKARKSSLKWELILDGAVRKYPDGREVCQSNEKGADEYYRRIGQMADRQGNLCCLCDGSLRYGITTFEHTDGRGMGGGHRDDRIEIDGRAVNGAAHWHCNVAKGSKRA